MIDSHMMGGSDMQFCLRWNNFGSTMTAALHSLHEGGDFVDVTLAADGMQLRAHKLVLSACSPYFRDILKNNPCPHPVIILREVPIEDLEAVLAFMYEGQVNVSQTRLHTFMKLAEVLQIRGLTDAQTARTNLEKDAYHSVMPSENLSSSNPVVAAAAAAVAAVSTTASSTSAGTAPCIQHPPMQSVQARFRTHDSPPPPPKRRKPSPSQHTKSPKQNDDEYSSETQLDNKRRVKANMLTVKLEPDEYPDEIDHDDESEQPPVPAPEVNFVEPAADVHLRSASGSSSMQSIFLSQHSASDKSSHQPPRRNSHDKATLHLEFPQGPSCQHLPYPCPFCEKAYTSWGFRRRHIKGYHTSSPELPCKWCYAVLPSHQEWEEHVTRTHNVAMGDARNGLLILEEAHMVLQIAQPTRIDSLMLLIKGSKDKGEDSGKKDVVSKEAEKNPGSKDKGESSK